MNILQYPHSLSNEQLEEFYKKAPEPKYQCDSYIIVNFSYAYYNFKDLQQDELRYPYSLAMCIKKAEGENPSAL